MSLDVSVAILTKNEHDRLGAALASVSWAREIVVVDSGSTDGTEEMALAAGARVVQIEWKGWVDARNQALTHPSSDWVLFLDADERVSPELAAEIEELLGSDETRFSGFDMPRRSQFLQYPIRHGTWSPDRKLRLGRRSRQFRCEGGRVHEVLVVDGPVGRLRSSLLHFPYRDVSDALRRISHYARLSAEDHFEKGQRGNLVRLLLRPVWEFFRSFFVKLGFLDGVGGFAVAVFHSSSYFLRAAYLFEMADQEKSKRLLG